MNCSLLLLPSIRRGYFVPHVASLGKDPNFIFIECILLLHHKVGKKLICYKSRTACIKICNTGPESLKENLSKSLTYCFLTECQRAFPGGSDSKASAYKVGDPCSIPGSGRSPGEENGNPVQYSCLENPTDGGAGRLQSMGSKSRTQLSNFTSLEGFSIA